MKEQSMGMNRTGVQMSPFDTADMTKGMPASMTPATPGDDTALADMRGSYIAEAGEIGSVPLPGSVKGVATIAAPMFSGDQPQLLLDKLGERLAFERTGTRLYDALIAKFTTLRDDSTSMTLADLLQIRADEARHFSVVNEAVTALGGDPTAQTPCADIAGVEAQGLVQVVTDPRTTIAQALHAILVAEMTDNAGWELLIALAEDEGQSAMVTDFSLALTEERTHLQRVQQWVEEATIGRAISDGVAIDDVADANPSQALQ